MIPPIRRPILRRNLTGLPRAARWQKVQCWARQPRRQSGRRLEQRLGKPPEVRQSAQLGASAWVWKLTLVLPRFSVTVPPLFPTLALPLAA